MKMRTHTSLSVRITAFVMSVVLLALGFQTSVLAQQLSIPPTCDGLEVESDKKTCAERFYQKNSVYFLDNGTAVANCPSDPAAATTKSTSVSGDVTKTGTWNSGLKAPFILEQFAIETLKDVADKSKTPRESVVTKEHVLALLGFMYGEGGDINNKSSVFNILNTGINAPDLVDGAHRGDGVQAFKSFDAGVEGTARTIVRPQYSRMLDVLVNPTSKAQDFAYALSYYMKYPGNALWAEASKPPKTDSYYQRELGFISAMQKNYTERASTIIGTPEKEAQTGAKDKSKLQFDGTGTSQVNVDAGGSGSGDCSEVLTGDSQNLDGFTVFNQFDPAWVNKPYSSSTVGESGCAPSSIAMIATTFGLKDINPAVVAKWAGGQEKQGDRDYYEPGAGSSWDLMIDGPAHYGLKSSSIGTDMQKAVQGIAAGGYIIVSGQGPKPFTTGGHILVLRAAVGSTDDLANIKLYVGDSGHSDTSTKAYSVADLSGSIKNMWLVTK
jgi:hypothetical protein